LVIAFAIADVMDRAAREPRLRRRVVAASLLLVASAMTAEQYNIGRNAGLDRTTELAQLAAVPTPPSYCRAFFLTIPKDHPPAAYIPSIEAMLLSQEKGVPTVNGFSGQFPAGYGSVADPGSPDYERGVQNWIAVNGIAAGMCDLRTSTGTWSPYR
jgi:hypothetical protein